MDRHSLAILVPILVPLGVFAMVFGIRYLENQERMAMIAKGMTPPQRGGINRDFNPSRTLRNALVLVGAGLGLLLAIWIDHTFYPYSFDGGDHENRAEGYYFALIAIGAGIGLLTSYAYERKNPPRYPNDSHEDNTMV